METKTPGLTKLILIVESAFLVIAYAVLFILKNTQDMPNLSWLWGATMFFCVLPASVRGMKTAM
jgi:hypothetical protein